MGLTGLQLCAMPEKQICGKCGSEAGALLSKALWALIIKAKLVKRRPDGRILSDEDDARDRAEAKATAEKRMEAQQQRAAAAVAADLAARGIGN